MKRRFLLALLLTLGLAETDCSRRQANAPQISQKQALEIAKRTFAHSRPDVLPESYKVTIDGDAVPGFWYVLFAAPRVTGPINDTSILVDKASGEAKDESGRSLGR